MINKIKILRQKIISCQKCPRLVSFREKIAAEKRKSFKNWEYWGKPVPGFGDKNSKIMIIGLAPAAHGANRTGRVFTGDKSADFLFKSLHETSLSNIPRSEHRDDGLILNAYMTVAVKCVPPGDKPSALEKANCEVYLNKEFVILDGLKVIVGLGKIAFDAVLKNIKKKYPILMKDFPFKHGARYLLPNKIALYASFHPSPRNVNTGKLSKKMLTDLFLNVKKEIST